MIVPAGIVGTEALFPVGGEALHPVRIETRMGRPIIASVLQTHTGGDRRLMMDVIGLAIAELLPVEYRGAYGDDAADLDDARGLLRIVCRFTSVVPSPTRFPGRRIRRCRRF